MVIVLCGSQRWTPKATAADLTVFDSDILRIIQLPPTHNRRTAKYKRSNRDDSDGAKDKEITGIFIGRGTEAERSG